MQFIQQRFVIEQIDAGGTTIHEQPDYGFGLSTPTLPFNQGGETVGRIPRVEQASQGQAGKAMPALS